MATRKNSSRGRVNLTAQERKTVSAGNKRARAAREVQSVSDIMSGVGSRDAVDRETAVTKTMRELTDIDRERRGLDPVGPKPFKGEDAPYPRATDRQRELFTAATNKFKSAKSPAELEKQRSVTGKLMQYPGMVGGGGAAEHPCQGEAGCRNVLTADAPDVICPSCEKRGDVAGKTYKERPAQSSIDAGRTAEAKASRTSELTRGMRSSSAA